MIAEQALFHLPEILNGSSYPDQMYEGGMVAAFSLALLQALNGRNVPNPISCIQSEKPYRGRIGWPVDKGDPRFLRADLHLKLHPLRVGSESLAAYGWRHENWIEAKFIRHETNQQQNTAALLGDLLRLMTLAPLRTSKRDNSRDICGRYLLSIFLGDNPDKYVSVRIDKHKEDRRWLNPLIRSGRHEAFKPITLGDYETNGILDDLNQNLGELTFTYSATTQEVKPVILLGKDYKQYTCLLTRIDSFTVSRGTTVLSVHPDRTFLQGQTEAEVTVNIREFVGKWIKSKATGAETELPDVSETEEEEQEQ